MKKWIMLVVLCIIGNLVHASVTIEKGDDVSWVIDSNVTYNGLGTLKTGSITDGESTSVVLTFTDTDFIELFVKTSTEAGCDKLIIECNDEIYEYSGESMWESVPLQLENEQTVTLTYLKDGSVSNGQDCCWVWFEGADSLLFDDINNSDEEYKQKWEMSNEYPWSYCGDYADLSPGAETRPYIAAPDIKDGEESWITYEIEGTQVFLFKYLIVTEENVSPLIVSVDGVDVASFGGRRIFESYLIELPTDGRHTIRWLYRKPIGTSCTLRIWFDGVEDVVLNGYSMSSQDSWSRESETYDGDRDALRSGIVFDNGVASFSVVVPKGEDCFEYAVKVSSEEGHDFLRVYRNEELINSLSGEMDWEVSSLEVTPGDVFKFEYTKDNNGLTSGQDCGWVYFNGIQNFMSIMHLFPEDANSAEVTQTITLDLNTGREEVRRVLDGDEGVSFASSNPSAWQYDEAEEAMRSAVVAQGGESWMAASVIGKGTFSFNWKCLGETLACYVDGVLREDVSPTSSWTQVDVELTEDARHEIKWIFVRSEEASDVTACGWVDGVVWNAPEGWDDPDEPIVPDTVSTFITLDLRPSPRQITEEGVSEQITYDPAWVSADSVVLTVNEVEVAIASTSGTLTWTPSEQGVFEMQLSFKDAQGNVVGDPLTTTFKCVLDPLPEIEAGATDADVIAIMKAMTDGRLRANIVDRQTYLHFYQWLEAHGIDHQAVAESPFAWLSYALDVNGVIASKPQDGDLVVETFTASNTANVFELVLSVKEIAVGAQATASNLSKVFQVEGATNLTSEQFSSEVLSYEFLTPEGGKVKLSISPKDISSSSFFLKVKMEH